MGQTLDEQKLIELMVGYQNGSMDDFAELFELLREPLSRYLWTFVRDRTTAEDLLQEAFLQIHRARHSYTPPRPVRPWVYAICRHVALMHLRSRRRRKATSSTCSTATSPTRRAASPAIISPRPGCGA